MSRVRVSGLVAAAFLVAASSLSSASEPTKSPNVKVIKKFRFHDEDAPVFTGATDLDFRDRYAYVGGGGGLRIFDIGKRIPRKLSFFRCPGDQNDVAVVRRGIVALGYHQAKCGSPTGGVTFFNVRNPRRPRLLSTLPHGGTGVHTLTRYPGTSYLYLSPANPSDANRPELIVDASDPGRPRVVSSFDPGSISCHDVTFHFTRRRKLAFCAGRFEGQTQIWNVRNPLRPKVVTSITNPAIYHHHLALATPDGEHLVIGDENTSSQGSCHGSLWIYDIRDLKSPQLVSIYNLPPGRSLRWCTPHNFNFLPTKPILVGAWYSAGMSVVDLTNPEEPKEIASYVEAPIDPNESQTWYWSAYWFKGRIFATDEWRGMDVFRVRGL